MNIVAVRRIRAWGIGAVLALSVGLADLPARAAEEVSFTFEISSVPVERSKRYAVLDIAVTMVYLAAAAPETYPDVQKVVPHVTEFVQKYQDPKQGKSAYYEVIAKAAAAEVLAKYPAVASATVVLTVHTDQERSYRRIARAVVTR